MLASLACLCAAPPADAVILTSDPAQPTRTARTLTSDTGGWICFPGCTFSYAWQRCTSTCTTVGGATRSSYLLTTPDIDTRIRSVVTATDGLGSAARPSAQTATVAAAPPMNLAPPSASGTARVGATLTSSLGSWDDPNPADISITRAWLRCTTTSPGSCTPVSAAAGYVLTDADVGRYIRRSETAEGLGSASAMSGAIGQVVSSGGSSRQFSSGGSADLGRGNRLRPFPVLVISGRVRGRRTLIRRFIVRGPRRARVRLRCRGRCPFRRISATIGRSRRLRVRRAEGAYRAGSVLEVRITGQNQIGKFTRLRFRRGSAPARRDLCLRPGANRPSRCSG